MLPRGTICPSMRDMASKPPTASQLRKVRLLLERADAEISRLSALPDTEHTGAHRLLDIPPECAVCADIRRWQEGRNQLKALDIHIQAEIARMALLAEKNRGERGAEAHRKRAEPTRQRILDAAKKVGNDPKAIIEHLRQHGEPVHDEKTIRGYLKESGGT
jgi:hypothetical protein